MQTAELAADVARLNHPVVDLAAALHPNTLAAWLEHEFAEHQIRTRELAAAFGRFLVATAAGINDEATTGRATDFAKQHKAEIAAIDETRTRIKAPVLHAQRLIDGEGKKLADPLKATVAVIEQRIGVFLRQKADAARKAAEQEAQRLAEAAHAAMREAEAAPENTEAAIVALHDAQQAEALATAPTPELSRTRSMNGSLAGLKDQWSYRVADITKVPAAYLTINDVMIKAMMKSAGKQIADLKIPGLEFVNSPVAFVR